LALDHPAYDCVYIAIAEAEELQFVTADTGVLRRVSAGSGSATPSSFSGLTTEAQQLLRLNSRYRVSYLRG
jgi:hypothetical protein